MFGFYQVLMYANIGLSKSFQICPGYSKSVLFLLTKTITKIYFSKAYFVLVVKYLIVKMFC